MTKILNDEKRLMNLHSGFYTVGRRKEKTVTVAGLPTN